MRSQAEGKYECLRSQAEGKYECGGIASVYAVH